MPVTPDHIIKTIIQQRSRLIGYAWVVVGDADAAEDVLQDVSLAAVKKADQIEDEAHLQGWLRQAIRLRGMELRRAKLNQARLLRPEVLDLIEQADPGALGNSDSDSDSERMAALRRCIELLGDRAQQTLAMRYGQDIKPAEIAEQTGRSLKSVYQMITRTHATLRQCVRERLGTDGGKP